MFANKNFSDGLKSEREGKEPCKIDCGKHQNLFCQSSLQSEDHSYDSERGHGVSEAQISIVHTVGVVGPAPATI